MKRELTEIKLRYPGKTYIPLHYRAFSYDDYVGEDSDIVLEQIANNASLGATHWRIETNPHGEVEINSNHYGYRMMVVKYWMKR